MKIKEIIFIVVIAVIVNFTYNFFTKLSKEEKKIQNSLLQSIVDSQIDELSIVIYHYKNYSYLKIDDEKILQEFLDALKSDTYVPEHPTRQYNLEYIISIHSGSHSYLIQLCSDTFNSRISRDSVEVILYTANDINIYDLYYKCKKEDKDFYELFIKYYGYGEYTLRNHKLLYDVINKYFKDKGEK